MELIPASHPAAPGSILGASKTCTSRISEELFKVTEFIDGAMLTHLTVKA